MNGHGGEVLGEPAFRSLLEVDIPVDVVDVFRPPKEVRSIAEEAGIDRRQTVVATGGHCLRRGETDRR
ncbi:MAG: CoA-binding protein [Acidimicrobiia bacterium]